jgi:hypothetical protein
MLLDILLKAFKVGLKSMLEMFKDSINTSTEKFVHEMLARP